MRIPWRRPKRERESIAEERNIKKHKTEKYWHKHWTWKPVYVGNGKAVIFGYVMRRNIRTSATTDPDYDYMSIAEHVAMKLNGDDDDDDDAANWKFILYWGFRTIQQRDA